MDRHQKYLLGLLKEIDAICQAHGVEYTICGGTLLGAFRHGGFIPWDDDADICMTADNWEKFKKACETDLPEGRLLGAPELQEDYGFQCPRYVDTTTTRYFKAGSLSRGFPGEVIDIFILDPIADGVEALRRYMESVVLIHEISNCASTAANRYGIDARLVYEWEQIAQEKGRLEACRMLDARMKETFDDAGQNYIYRWQWGIYPMPKSVFENAVYVPFEDTQLPVPQGIFERLFWEYDERWPEFPPSVSVNQHGTPFSLDFSFQEFREGFTPSQDAGMLEQDMAWRKHTLMDNGPLLYGLRDDLAKARGCVLSAELERHVQRYAAEFERAYDERDATALFAILGEYIDRQDTGGLVGYPGYNSVNRFIDPVLAETTDEIFEAAVFALVGQDRLRSARRFVDAWCQTGHEATPLMDECQAHIRAFIDAVACYERGKYARGLVLSDGIRSVFPESNMQLKLNCLLLQALAEQGDADAKARFAEALSVAERLFADDGFYLKLQGDVCSSEGDEEAARALWMQATELTCNGFVLEDAFQKTGYHPTWMREAEWAELAGIAEWEGELPERVNHAAPATPKLPKRTYPMAEEVPECLYRLLRELASICDREGIPYSVSGRAVRALKDEGRLPDTLEAFGIYCAPSDLERLANAIAADASLSGNRFFEYSGTNPSMKKGIGCYCARDTALLRMSTPSWAKRSPYLGIAMNPIENLATRYKVEPVSELASVVAEAVPVAKAAESEKRLETENRSSGLAARMASAFKRAFASGAGSAASSDSSRDAAAKEPSKQGESRPESVFAYEQIEDARGVRFSVLAGMDLCGVELNSEFKLKAADVCSTVVSGDTLLQRGALPQDYFQREKAAAAVRKELKRRYEPFAKNYEEISEAVAQKQRSIQQSADAR